MITFRPHHFMCTLGFQGMGYSPAFVTNYKDIAATLMANPHTDIKVSFTLDSICRACPHQTVDGFCESQEKIDSLDMRHGAILNLNEGDVLTWSEGLARIKEHMTLEAFHKACTGCSWKESGVCERALKSLLNSENQLKSAQSA